MTSWKPLATPIIVNEKLKKKDGGKKKVDKTHFWSLDQNLLYLMVQDVTPHLQQVYLIIRFMYSPSYVHFGAMKRVLRYLQSIVKWE